MAAGLVEHLASQMAANSAAEMAAPMVYKWAENSEYLTAGNLDAQLVVTMAVYLVELTAV